MPSMTLPTPYHIQMRVNERPVRRASLQDWINALGGAHPVAKMVSGEEGGNLGGRDGCSKGGGITC